jgi:glycosyltransferase involved in cell wall biosynthesis
MEVTVLLLTYNHEKYIAQALDTVLMQETDFDYEIVIIEDCSTDATRDIVKAYHQRYPDKIRLRLSEQNRRIPGPFAEAFDAVQTPFVAILDGDDYWTSRNKLQKQVDFLRSHPECVLCFHNALRMYEDQNRAPLIYNSSEQKTISEIEDLWQYCFIASCTAMLRKDSMGKLPGWYHTLRVGDWPLFLFRTQRGKIGYIDEILGVYRIHGEGAWQKLDSIQRLEDRVAFYQTMNANLDFRYNHIVEPLISAHQKELAIARSVVETVQRILPSGAAVIIMSRADEDLPLKGYQVWPFPSRSGKQTEQLFASGPAGSAEATWIAPDTVYEFRLSDGGVEDKSLASVTVIQEESLLCSPLRGPPLRKEGVFIDASPDPVPAGSRKTTVNWSTGDQSPGVVRVLMKSLQVQYPADNAEAIEQLETLRMKGGQFLLVPHKLFSFLERYPGLIKHLDNHYRLAHKSESCLIYDLRETRSEGHSDTAVS